MKSKVVAVYFLSIFLLCSVLTAVNADNGYTIKEYIANYYSEIYREGADAAFDKITIQDTNRKNELWVLTGNLSEYNVFNSKIEKVENPYVIQTAERYYITLQSTAGNYLYLCITKNGEMFFGRYADYNKPNYCEYIVAESAAVSNELSQICQTGINGYINQNSAEGVPECSNWAQGIVTKGAELSFIPSYLLKTHFSESASRIDFCRMAYKMLNVKQQIRVIERTHPFTDVDKDERELAYLYENGIIKGKSATEFCPNDSISREEAATILDRLFKFIYKTDADNSDKEKLYADDNTISDWAKNSVYSMKTHKIMIGVDNETFSPKTPFSLEQTVVTLVRIYEYK